MAKRAYVSYERNYTHSTKWRPLGPHAFRIAHCLWNHCDDFGLICIEPIDSLRYIIERRDARIEQLKQVFEEIKTTQLLHLYQSRQGIVACFPDYPRVNWNKNPLISTHLPVPDEILFAEPDYADIILRYQAKLGQHVHSQPSGAPALQQALALWNAFATEHGKPQASETPSRIAHWRARTKESKFDFAQILNECTQSNWLMGRTNGRDGTPFKLNLDYLIDGPNNYVKILEGKYRTTKPGPGTAGPNQQGTNRQGGSTRTTFVPNIDRIRDIGSSQETKGSQQ